MFGDDEQVRMQLLTQLTAFRGRIVGLAKQHYLRDPSRVADFEQVLDAFRLELEKLGQPAPPPRLLRSIWDRLRKPEV